jgi:hypothetical protein
MNKMGADLCISTVMIPSGKEKATEKKIMKAIKEFKIPELGNDIKLRIVASLNKKYSKEFEEFCGFWEEGLYKEFNDNLMPISDSAIDDDQVLTEKEAREIMKGVAEDFFACLNYRDVTYISHKGDNIYLTGGMSWGDPPTDSTGAFQKFCMLPPKILKAGGLL